MTTDWRAPRTRRANLPMDLSTLDPRMLNGIIARAARSVDHGKRAARRRHRHLLRSSERRSASSGLALAPRLSGSSWRERSRGHSRHLLLLGGVVLPAGRRLPPAAERRSRQKARSRTSRSMGPAREIGSDMTVLIRGAGARRHGVPPARAHGWEAWSASRRIEPKGTSAARPAGAAARPRRTAVAVLSFGLTGESTLCATRPRSP
jgi:hypothetical protein